MKAITCPQCGSLIRNVLPNQQLFECEYCGVKVVTDERFPTLEPFDVEAAKFQALQLPVPPKTKIQPIFIGISLVGAFTLLLFIVAMFPNKSRRAPQTSMEIYKPVVLPANAPASPKIAFVP
jgi:DNA-directed RNA polymerase subunit RPC12/RpoP